MRNALQFVRSNNIHKKMDHKLLLLVMIRSIDLRHSVVEKSVSSFFHNQCLLFIFCRIFDIEQFARRNNKIIIINKNSNGKCLDVHHHRLLVMAMVDCWSVRYFMIFIKKSSLIPGYKMYIHI